MGLNPAMQLGCCAETSPLGFTVAQSQCWESYSVHKRASGKKKKKNPKDKLMNTYALVIKLFWLHYALFFFLPTVSLFFLPFAVSQTHTFLSPSKGKSRLENRRMLDCTKAIRYSKINLGRLYYGAPVPAAMHICLASAHFRWLARWYCVFIHFLSATLQ